MKWIKHDTDANQDAKLQNVLLDYGLEGYGLYWYCLELIAGRVDVDNVTFELEHDARIIARNVGSTPQKVEEMMRYFVKNKLFEGDNGVITCMKLAKRLDRSMTSNPQMREIISNLKSHDSVMTKSEKVMQDKIRLDKNRIDKNILLENEKKLSNAFDIFYSAGLVKKSKVAAFKKFKSLTKEMKADPFEFAELLSADVKHRVAMQQFGIDKLHPSTYLNQQRWTDEHETNNGQLTPNGKQSAAERIKARNNAKYGQPSGRLGLGESNRNLRGTVDQGEWGNAIKHVDNGIEYTEPDSSEDRD